MYLDQHTGKLYVYATRNSDGTAGVVCVDTTIAAANPDPFCGYTQLTGAGEASAFGFSAVGSPQLIGKHWYAFNFVTGSEQSGAKNTVMCFDVGTDAACAGQPYTVSLGAGPMQTNLPSPSVAAIGNKLIIPLEANSEQRITCFDDATQGTCSGAWPITLPNTVFYVGENGAPFP